MASKKTKKSKSRAKSTRKPKSKAPLKKKSRKIRTASNKKSHKKKMVERGISAEAVAYKTRGLGANSAGQSGDTQGLPEVPVGESESVEELLEEGQTYEAEVLEGVENARDADKSEVKTRQVSEDDVPEEYRERD